MNFGRVVCRWINLSTCICRPPNVQDLFHFFQAWLFCTPSFLLKEMLWLFEDHNAWMLMFKMSSCFSFSKDNCRYSFECVPNWIEQNHCLNGEVVCLHLSSFISGAWRTHFCMRSAITTICCTEVWRSLSYGNCYLWWVRWSRPQNILLWAGNWLNSNQYECQNWCEARRF